MNFLKYLDYLKVFGKFLFYTLAYIAGKRSATQEIEAESAKKSLEEATRVYEKREATKEKYIDIKKKTPNEWRKKAG